MATFKLETKRPSIRPFHAGDAENMFQLNGDENVQQLTGDGPFPSVESAKLFIIQYLKESDVLLSRWTVLLKSTQ